MYLDTLDSYYSISHEKKVSASKTRDNDRTIGKPIILIIAFIAYIIWTIFDAYVYGIPPLDPILGPKMFHEMTSEISIV